MKGHSINLVNDPFWRGYSRLGLLRMFRAKEMALPTWSRFLEAIDQAALDGRERIPALLVRDFVGAEKSLILLAGEKLERFEAASPGGWMDYADAQEDQWIFLAGDRSLVGKLGLKLSAK